jgi:dihydrofolate synthase/folylpolyglutamate synthase
LERVAKLENCEFTLIGKDIQYELISHSLDGQVVSIRRRWSSSPQGASRPAAYSTTVQIPLLGSHQLENAATAYAALHASGLEVPDEAIQKGFAQVKWRGRFEVARRDPPVIFDSAHNDDSFARLYETLETYFPGKPVYLIFGASEDKNIPGMFAAMKPKIKRLLVTRANHPRALGEEMILGWAQQAGLKAEAVSPVESALQRALELSANDGSIVLSAGSMFVTAEAMRAWNNFNPTPKTASGA